MKRWWRLALRLGRLRLTIVWESGGHGVSRQAETRLLVA